MDDNKAFTNIVMSPGTYGFTVATNGALEDPSLTNKSFNGPGADYVFWDVVHPTTKLDAMTGGAAYELVAVGLNLAQSGTNFNLTVSNLCPGLPYTMQSSTNLTAWSNYQSFNAVSTNTNMAVTNGPRNKAYYRVAY